MALTSSSSAPSPLSLLVVTDGASMTYPLPSEGAVVVGRGPSANIRVEDPAMSRVHARIRIGESLVIEDLGSANGTAVHSVPLRAKQRVEFQPGSVIEIGNTIVVVQGHLRTPAGFRRPPRPRRLATHGYFEMRLEEACLCHHTDGFGVLRVTTTGIDAAQAQLELAKRISHSDVLAAYRPDEYELLLLDTAPAQIAEIVERIRRAFASHGGSVRVGAASYPKDGRTPEALIACAGQARRATRRSSSSTIIRDPVMQRVHRLVQRVSGDSMSVLLLGETGVGKEILAQAVHDHSPRADHPFVKFGCAALTRDLVESELFGHEIGAFPGAEDARPGVFERARGGTLLLDEIAELPFETQLKLQNAIETQTVTRLGSDHARAVDVRIVATTNRVMDEECEAGRFSPELLEQLNGISIVIPPLRNRRSEIEALARLFITQFSQEQGRIPAELSAEALQALQGYEWPGNVRELKNVIERAVLLCEGPTIYSEHLPQDKLTSRIIDPAPQPKVRMDDDCTGDKAPEVEAEGPTMPPESKPDDKWQAQRDRIMAALEQCQNNQTRAAKVLGVSRRTLVSWLVRYRIPRPHKPLPGPADPRDISRPGHEMTGTGEGDAWQRERARIVDALDRCSGNQTRAAKLLGMSRRTLVSRLVTHRIPRPRKALPGAAAN